MKKTSFYLSAAFALALTVGAARSAQAASTAEIATTLFLIYGSDLAVNDPDRPSVESLIAQGKYEQAAAIAVRRPGFINRFVKRWVSPWTNRADNPLEPLNNMSAMIIGTIRDDRAMTELLTGNYGYRFEATLVTGAGVNAVAANPREEEDSDGDTSRGHYFQAERLGLDMSNASVFVRVDSRQAWFAASANPVEIPDVEAAGVLTSPKYLFEHANMGTNRRLTAEALKRFLDAPLENIRTALNDARVGQDVDRKATESVLLPDGSTKTISVYLNRCVTCHAGNDGLRSGTVFLDYRDGRPRFQTSVQSKIFRGDATYPTYRPTDDSFVNYFATAPALAWMEWSSMTSGNGMRGLGQMFAAAGAFPRAMAKKALIAVCGKNPIVENEAILNELKNRFIASGYNGRRLFELAARPECLGVPE